MSAQQTNPPTSPWTEPPWLGWIETTGDALLILEAARRGLIPRVTRRLVDSERKMITSGSVFVFDEDESGIKRWTDGFYWSPSRILGNFLLYRETDKRGAGHRSCKGDTSHSDGEHGMEGAKQEGSSLSRPRTESSHLGGDKQLEKILLGSLTNSYKFKPDGLMKKTFSLTIGGVVQHLISYYKIEDVYNGRLRSPSSLPELASLDISPDYLEKTHFRNPPKVEVGIDGIRRYRGEADEIEPPPALLPAPLSTALPSVSTRIGESPTNRRPKRFDPYTEASSKRPRRQTKSATEGEAASSTRQSTESRTVTTQAVTTSAIYPPSAAPAPPAAAPPPTSYPVPFGVPGFYQIPPYIPSPAMFYPPGTASPVPPVPPGYTFQPTPAGDSGHQTSTEVAPHGYYPYHVPPVAGYPPGYAGAWPNYSMCPVHASGTGTLPVSQSSNAISGEQPDGNHTTE